VKPKIEFKYDRNKDMTNIYIYQDGELADIRNIPGMISSYMKTKIRKELENEEDYQQ